jgi:uncharacterized protein
LAAHAGLLLAILTRDTESVAVLPLTFALGTTLLVGTLLSGPVPAGDRSSPALLRAVGLAVALFTVFLVLRLGIGLVPPVDRAVERVLRFSDEGAGRLVVLGAVYTAVAEEAFFRGAVWAALPRDQAVGTTGIYVAVTLFSLSLPLVLAAALAGTVFALQRRTSGGVASSAVTHVVWSVLMLTLLPR